MLQNSRFPLWPFFMLFFGLSAYITLAVFPRYQKQLEEHAGTEVEILDVRWQGYNQNDISTLFNALTKEGREVYRENVGVVDMIYPLTYLPMLVLLLAMMGRSLGAGRWRWAIVLPILGAILDYTENTLSLRLLDQWDSLSQDTAQYASLATQGKWIFLVLTILVAFFVGIMLVLRKIRK